MGLDDFKTEGPRTRSKSSKDKDKDWEGFKSVTDAEWSNMSTEEKVRHARKNGIEDFYPDFKLDGGWQYEKIVRVKCTCGKVFTFNAQGECPVCGSEYKDSGRAVIKVIED